MLPDVFGPVVVYSRVLDVCERVFTQWLVPHVCGRVLHYYDVDHRLLGLVAICHDLVLFHVSVD